jgi:hypothetical protein
MNADRIPNSAPKPLSAFIGGYMMQFHSDPNQGFQLLAVTDATGSPCIAG